MARVSPARLRAALQAQLESIGEPPDEGPDDASRLRLACLAAVLRALDAGQAPLPEALRVAVRLLLDRLAVVAPGRSVEVRVPPYAATQCVAGPRHTRGTPPNIVEVDPLTWVELATGRTTWAQARAEGRVQASGSRADLSAYLPLDVA